MRAAAIMLLAGALCACGGEATSPGDGTASTSITFAFSGLRALDPGTEGTFEAWTSDGSGQFRSLGRFDYAPSVTLPLQQAVGNGAELWITIEPPGDEDQLPGARFLRGTLDNRSATLRVVGAITQGQLELKAHPGQFTMFSPSDNAIDGYPSHEESGVWLFNMRPELTEQDDMWVRLTQLDPAWTYEGWMVRDIDTPNAIWLSYGKFTPDYTGTVNKQDDTGWGPFSGVINFRTDTEEEFPGDDWISNPLNYPFPATLTLPLDLRETDANNHLRWTHVITVEPARDRGEPLGSERPFLVRPYQDSFGAGGPGVARTITYYADGVPSAQVTAR